MEGENEIPKKEIKRKIRISNLIKKLFHELINELEKLAKYPKWIKIKISKVLRTIVQQIK